MLDCQPIISKSYNVGPGSNKTSKLGLFSNCYLQSTYLHCTLPAKVNSLNESFYPWAVPSTTSKVVVTFNLRLRNEFQPFLAKIKPLQVNQRKKIFFFKWFNFYEQTFRPVTTHKFSKLWFDNDNFNNRWKLRRKETSLLEQLFLKERNCPSPFN